MLWECVELWALTWIKHLDQTHSSCRIRIQKQTQGTAVDCRGREGDAEFFKREFYLNIKGLWEAFGRENPMKTLESLQPERVVLQASNDHFKQLWLSALGRRICCSEVLESGFVGQMLMAWRKMADLEISLNDHISGFSSQF